MNALLRKLLSVYMDGNDGEGSDLGGAGADDSDGDDDAAAALIEAEKVKAEAAKPGKKITDSEAKLMKEMLDKKTALKAANSELAANKILLKKIEELGGIDALSAAANDKRTAEQKKLESAGEWDKVKIQMNDAHGKVLSAKEQEIADAKALNSNLLNTIADLTVGNAFSSSNFVNESLTLPAAKARKIYSGHFEFQDGAVVGFDKPAGAAERTILVDASGDPLNFDAALQKIIDGDSDRDSLLKSTIRPGAGSTTAARTSTVAATKDRLRGAEAIAAGILKGGLKTKD